MNPTGSRRPPKTGCHYILFYKPYGVLCQFRKAGQKQTLADFKPFPPFVHPAGRLDEDSEGLILLTDDGRLAHFLLDPRYEHPRTYLVQVERLPNEADLKRLREGVVIEGRATLPAGVRLISDEPSLPPRSTPIRFRKNVPTAWLEITLREGRNRQVRKMTAAVGHPTLRLVRIKIGNLTLRGLQPGEKRELTAGEIEKLQESVALQRKSVVESKIKKF